MLTSNVPADPSCGTTNPDLVDTADHFEAEESGWTDCFTWEKLLYTGKDLSSESSQLSTARVSTLTHSKARNYELIAADLILAREARQCLIADHTFTSSGGTDNLKGLRQARQCQADEHCQLTKSGVRNCKLGDDVVAAENSAYGEEGNSSLVSDASSGPSTSSSFTFTSAQFLKTRAGRFNDAVYNLANTAKRVERVTGGSKRVGGAFHDTAVNYEDTCRKTKRTAMPANLHSSSALSAALSSASAAAAAAASTHQPHECSATTSGHIL